MQYPNPFDSNYIEDNVWAVNYKDYIIEDSVELIEMRKYEILREDEGIIEECYYEFLQASKNSGKNNLTPFFALPNELSETQESGENE